MTPSNPSGNPKPKDEDSKYLLSCQRKPQKPDVSRSSGAAKNVNTSAPHHHITTHPSSCRRTSAKAKFKLSSHHPWDTFYCLSSMFNRLPHLKQMGISNSQSPSSSEACSLLASRKACVHRFGSLTSAGQIDPVWMGQESAHGKHRRYMYIHIYMTTRLMSHKVASVKMNTCITGCTGKQMLG